VTMFQGVAKHLTLCRHVVPERDADVGNVAARLSWQVQIEAVQEGDATRQETSGAAIVIDER
jgi:hypothetical protein